MCFSRLQQRADAPEPSWYTPGRWVASLLIPSCPKEDLVRSGSKPLDGTSSLRDVRALLGSGVKGEKMIVGVDAQDATGQPLTKFERLVSGDFSDHRRNGKRALNSAFGRGLKQLTRSLKNPLATIHATLTSSTFISSSITFRPISPWGACVFAGPTAQTQRCRIIEAYACWFGLDTSQIFAHRIKHRIPSKPLSRIFNDPKFSRSPIPCPLLPPRPLRGTTINHLSMPS